MMICGLVFFLFFNVCEFETKAPRSVKELVRLESSSCQPMFLKVILISSEDCTKEVVGVVVFGGEVSKRQRVMVPNLGCCEC